MLAAAEETVFYIDPVGHTLITNNGTYREEILLEGGLSGLAYSPSTAIIIGKKCRHLITPD